MRIDGGILTYQPNARHLQEENTPKGRKVVFIGVNGSERDRQKAKENLEVGETYTVEEIYVDRYSSEVRLQECPRHLFNTMLFEDLEPENESDDFLPPEESDKAKVTKEQLDVIERVRDSNMDALFDLMSSDKVLKKMKFQDVVKVYNGDYEVEEPTPKFEAGDLIINERTGVLVELNKQTAELTNTDYWDKENVRHATPDEIYWLHDLKRDCVNDFKLGDVVKQKDGDLCEVVDMYTGMVEDTYWCTVSDAIRWAEANEIEYIYPVESRKPYRKEEN